MLYGQDGRQRRGRAGRELGAFRRRPRPSLLSILSSLDIARCVARRRFSVVAVCRALRQHHGRSEHIAKARAKLSNERNGNILAF